MIGAISRNMRAARANVKLADVIAYAAIALLFLVLAYQLSARIQFPWDKMVWVESPFLTDMVKLSAGEPVFGTIEDGNSFVYSPGLTYLSYALLKPFGLQLDIRFGRLISVVAAALASAVMAWLFSQAVPRSRRGPACIGGSAVISFMILAQSYTFDIPHPDNLHILHSVATFALCLHAVTTKRFSIALLAAGFAGIGILTKQSGLLLLPAAGLTLIGSRVWNWRQYVVMALTGLAAFALALVPLTSTPEARFYAFEVMSGHAIFPFRYIEQYQNVFLSYPHRVILLIVSAVVLIRQTRIGFDRYHWVWLAFAICLLPPQMVAYTKDGAGANSWTLIDAFLFLIIWPVIGVGINRSNVLTKAAAFALIIALYPIKELPTFADYEYGREIELALGKDLQAGRRVLLAHGTAALLRAGYDEIPRDRALSIYETVYAHMPQTDGVKRRIREHYYDRIYLDIPPIWYGKPVVELLLSNYTVAAQIAGPQKDHGFRGGHSLLRHGYQQDLNPDRTLIFEPQTDTAQQNQAKGRVTTEMQE